MHPGVQTPVFDLWMRRLSVMTTSLDNDHRTAFEKTLISQLATVRRLLLSVAISRRLAEDATSAHQQEHEW